MSRRISACLVLITVAALVGACSPSVGQLQEVGDVEALVELIESDPSADVRAEAAAALGAIGSSEAVAALVGALDDPEATVRASAAVALGLLRDATAVGALLVALDDPDANVHSSAEDALHRLNEEAADPDAMRAGLIPIVAEGTTKARVVAIEMLASTGNEEALAALLVAADDASAEVRAAAVESVDALIVTLGPAAAPLLVDSLSWGGPVARQRAARGLGAYGDASAVSPLLAALSDADPVVQEAAALALDRLFGGMADVEVVESLVAAIRDSPTEVEAAARTRLEDVLVGMGPERAVAALATVKVGDRWLAVAVGVPESDLAAATRSLGIQIDPIEEIEAVAAAVALGTPAVDAAAYDGSPAYHPAIVIGETLWTYEVGAWQPTAMRFLQLVVVEDEISWQQIEECLYDGPSIIRYRGLQTVRVLGARDGALVAEQTFQGADPRACQPTEDYYLTELYGDAPDLAASVEWLESIIHPPAP